MSFYVKGETHKVFCNEKFKFLEVMFLMTTNICDLLKHVHLSTIIQNAPPKEHFQSFFHIK